MVPKARSLRGSDMLPQSRSGIESEFCGDPAMQETSSGSSRLNANRNTVGTLTWDISERQELNTTLPQPLGEALRRTRTSCQRSLRCHEKACRPQISMLRRNKARDAKEGNVKTFSGSMQPVVSETAQRVASPDNLKDGAEDSRRVETRIVARMLSDLDVPGI
jgi:hypothetical protein